MSENESASDNKSILLREDSNGICTLTLNRPEKRNALSSDLLTALQEAFDELADDKSIKVIILAANGPVFSSGHDLNEVRTDSSYAVMHALFEQCSDVMITMKKQPQPIIAKVHGTAMAAGCQLMANCDLAVATETAKFALPGSSIGLFCSTPAVAVGRVTSTKHRSVRMKLGVLGSSIRLSPRKSWMPPSWSMPRKSPPRHRSPCRWANRLSTSRWIWISKTPMPTPPMLWQKICKSLTPRKALMRS
jgi:hypothetical protein